MRRFNKIYLQHMRNWRNLIIDFSIWIFIVYQFIYNMSITSDSLMNKLTTLPFLLCGGYYLLMRGGRVLFDSFECMFTIFIFVCILSMLFSINFQDALDRCWILTCYFFILLLLHIYISTEHRTDYLLTILGVAGFLLGLYVISYYDISTYVKGMMISERMGRDVMNTNVISVQTGYAAIIFYWYANYRKAKWMYILMLFCSVISLGGGSRKGLVGIGFGIFLLYLFRGQGLKIIRSIIFACLALLIVYLGVSQLEIFVLIRTRFETFLAFFMGQGIVDNSTSVRMWMVKKGFEYFLDSPFMGIGIGNAHFLARQFVGYDYYLHNNYIELLASVGIIGTFAYYSLWIYPLYYLFHPARNGEDEAVILVTLLLTNLVLQYGYVAYYSLPSYLLLLAAHIKVKKLRRHLSNYEMDSIADKRTSLLA